MGTLYIVPAGHEAHQDNQLRLTAIHITTKETPQGGKKIN